MSKCISVVTLYTQSSPKPGYKCEFVLDSLWLLKVYSVVKYCKKKRVSHWILRVP